MCKKRLLQISRCEECAVLDSIAKHPPPISPNGIARWGFSAKKNEVFGWWFLTFAGEMQTFAQENLHFQPSVGNKV